MKHSLHFLLGAVGIEFSSGLANPFIEMITCDSRLCKKGSLFVGLQGEKVDGGSFWPQAIEAGADAAVIGSKAAKVTPPGPSDAVVIVQEPVGKILGELAAVFWQQPSSKMTLIGVTGTNGKTTTTHLIEYLGATVGKPAALFGTLVNRWPMHSSIATHTTGFADNLQAQLAEAVDAGAQLGAMEVSSHALVQQRVAGCRFAGAVFTNLTQDHLDYHITLEAYFEAKALLFNSPLLEAGINKVVVNIDDPWGARLADRLGDVCWRCSLANDAVIYGRAEMTITDVNMSPKGVTGKLHSPVGEGSFVSPLIGRFNLMNLLQAVGVLLQQGLPLGELLAAIPDFPGVPGRMEIVKATRSLDSVKLPTVLVDYAHTPDGLKNALIASRPFATGKLICVFGCGGDRDRGKRPQMAAIASQFADKVFLTSDNPRTEDPEQIINDLIAGILPDTLFLVEIDRASAISKAIAEATNGDVILIAGKGHEDYQILGSRKVHFDDREQAEFALESLQKLI